MNATVFAMLVAQTEVTQPSDVGRGIAIALTGMGIVAFALMLIIFFIMALPYVLAFVAEYFPETEDPHSRTSHPESQVPDDEAVLAAIGYVMHLRNKTS